MLYVLDRKTLRATKSCPVLDYAPIVIESYDDTRSTVTVPLGGVLLDDLYNWILIDDRLFWLAIVSPEEETTTLTLEPIWRAFDRTLYYDGTEYETIGSYISAVLQAEYIDQTDEEYAMPYLDITDYDETEFEPPTDDTYQLFHFTEYLEDLIYDEKIKLQAIYERHAIHLVIWNSTPISRTVIFNDGHTLYESATFSDEIVGKVTTLLITKTTETVDEEEVETVDVESTDYYVDPEGNVTTEPGDRVIGRWVTISLSDDDDPLEQAEEQFKNNKNSYKIEWASDRDYNVGDVCRFKMGDGSVFNGTIIHKAIRASDNLFHYQSGTLATKLTDKLRSVK